MAFGGARGRSAHTGVAVRCSPLVSGQIFVGGSAQDRRVFIQDIVNLIQAKGAKTSVDRAGVTDDTCMRCRELTRSVSSLLYSLLVTIVDLSEYLHKQPALSPSNLFRKVRRQTDGRTDGGSTGD